MEQTAPLPVQLTSRTPRPPRFLFRPSVFVTSLKLESCSVLELLHPSCSCKHCKQTHWFPDVDECVEEAAPCGSVGECLNNVGSYSCVCPDGYRQINDTRCRGKTQNHTLILPGIWMKIYYSFYDKIKVFRFKIKRSLLNSSNWPLTIWKNWSEWCHLCCL